MAKYAKRKKAKRTTRRRRVGALALSPSSNLVKLGSVAVGYLFANQVNGLIDKVVPATVGQKIVGVAQAGAGYFLAFRKGGKSSMLKTLAGGIIAGAGVKRLAASMNLAGIGGYQMVKAVSGYQNVPAIGNRVTGYAPGPGGINGYQTSRQAVGSLLGDGSGVMN